MWKKLDDSASDTWLIIAEDGDGGRKNYLYIADRKTVSKHVTQLVRDYRKELGDMYESTHTIYNTEDEIEKVITGSLYSAHVRAVRISSLGVIIPDEC